MNIAVVTGAGRGLGRRIAEELSREGYTILATDLVEEAATETARQIGGHAWAMKHDVRSFEAHRRVAAAAHERGDVKLWVNNAGVLHAGLDWDLDVESLELQTEVNFYGVVHGCRAALETMRQTGGGHIINIASISSVIPAPGVAVYGATKHAVLGYSLSLAGELEDEGIPVKVSAICPDAIDTAMTRDVADREASDLLFSARKMLTPDEVAAQVVKVAERPRLVTIIPPLRGVMAQMVRPFPGLGLKVLRQFRKIGARHRRARAS
jgi:short-subunit dehydrogenase